MSVPTSVDNCESYKPQSYRVQLCRRVVLGDGWSEPITKTQVVNAQIKFMDDPGAGPREWNHASMTIGDWTVVGAMWKVLDDSPTVRKPMSDADVERLQEQYCWNCNLDAIAKIIREVERHHGIGQEGGK